MANLEILGAVIVHRFTIRKFNILQLFWRNKLYIPGCIYPILAKQSELFCDERQRQDLIDGKFLAYNVQDILNRPTLKLVIILVAERTAKFLD